MKLGLKQGRFFQQSLNVQNQINMNIRIQDGNLEDKLLRLVLQEMFVY